MYLFTWKYANFIKEEEDCEMNAYACDKYVACDTDRHTKYE